MEELLEFNEKALMEGKKYTKKRFIYQKINQLLKERVFIGLIGPRGVGKTVLLKQLLNEIESGFYINLETVVPEKSLYSIAEDLEKKGVKYLFIDEIHFYPNFAMDLKKIYDFLSIIVVFTGSAALSLHEASYDLSRRVRIIQVPPFSVREFIFFEKDELVDALSLEQIFDERFIREQYGKYIKFEPLFTEYLKGRNYPFTLGKTEYLPLFDNILQRILTNDILKTGMVSNEETYEIRNVLKFIGKSPVEDISYSSLSHNLGITKYKAEKYISVLEKTFILNKVIPKGTNVMKEPKILFTIPYRLLYKDFNECIGALKEDFFVDTLRFLNKEVYYLKTTQGKKTPDYLIEDMVIEIGGKGKGISQFKGLEKKKTSILTYPGQLDNLRRPLFMLGMVEVPYLSTVNV